MYNDLKKYNIAINKLNREIGKLKEALFAKSKKCDELQKANLKLANELKLQKKEIDSLKNSKIETPKQPSTKTRSYKKKK